MSGTKQNSRSSKAGLSTFIVTESMTYSLPQVIVELVSAHYHIQK